MKASIEAGEKTSRGRWQRIVKEVWKNAGCLVASCTLIKTIVVGKVLEVI